MMEDVRCEGYLVKFFTRVGGRGIQFGWVGGKLHLNQSRRKISLIMFNVYGLLVKDFSHGGRCLLCRPSVGRRRGKCRIVYSLSLSLSLRCS